MNEKYRHELKYLCTNTELELIERRIQAVLKPDPHADENGEYWIRSVYFDDINRTCYYDNENGIDPREKFRIRIYNRSEDQISLEKKKKHRTMTQKKSCRLDYDTCMKMLRGESLLDHFGHSELLDEWILARNQRLLKPVMLGEYVRKPYVGSLGNVRITFDRHITASRDYPALFEKDIFRISVLSTGVHILEVKYDDFLPDVLSSLIGNGHLLQNTFSKFYLGCNALEGSFQNVI